MGKFDYIYSKFDYMYIAMELQCFYMQKFDYIYSKSFAMELQCFHKGIKLGFVLKLTRHKKVS